MLASDFLRTLGSSCTRSHTRLTRHQKQALGVCLPYFHFELHRKYGHHFELIHWLSNWAAGTLRMTWNGGRRHLCSCWNHSSPLGIRFTPLPCQQDFTEKGNLRHSRFGDSWVRVSQALRSELREPLSAAHPSQSPDLGNLSRRPGQEEVQPSSGKPRPPPWDKAKGPGGVGWGPGDGRGGGGTRAHYACMRHLGNDDLRSANQVWLSPL